LLLLQEHKIVGSLLVGVSVELGLQFGDTELINHHADGIFDLQVALFKG
jgi:hypothetical protein